MQQWESRPGRRSGFPWLRLAIVGLSLVLGVVLLVHGSIVVGGLVTVLAFLRLVVLLRMQRRRRAFAAHRRGTQMG